MIEVIVNNESLDLFSNTTIEFNLNSPIFNEGGVIPGSYTIPFSIPLTDRNKIIIKHPNIIESTSKWDAVGDVVIITEGLPYKKGILKIQKSPSPNKIDIYAEIKPTFVQDSFKNDLISKYLDYEVEIAPNNSIEKYIIVGFPITAGAVVKMPLRLFVNGNEVSYFKAVTNNDANVLAVIDIMVARINNRPGVIATNIGKNDTSGFYEIKLTSRKPFDFSREINIDLPFDYIVSEDSSDDPISNKLTFVGTYIREFINTYSENYFSDYLDGSIPNDIVRFPFFKNEGFQFGDVTPLYINVYSQILSGGNPLGNIYYINYPDVGQITDTDDDGNSSRSWGENFNNSITCPFIRLEYIIDQIKLDFGSSVSGNFLDDEIISDLLIFPTDVPMYDDTFPGNNEYVLHLPQFNLKDYISKITISELFKILASKFALAIIFDEPTNSIIIDRKKDIIGNGNYKDITVKCSEYIDLDKTEVKGLTLSNDVEIIEQDAVAVSEDPYKKFVLGDGEIELKSKAVGFPEINGVIVGPFNYPNIPWYDQADTKDDNLRLIFDTGVKDRDGGEKYYSASNNNGSVELSWFGNNGLYEIYWKEWVNFLINRTYSKRSVMFNIADLLNLDFKEKYRIDRVDYLIKSIRTVHTMQGVKPSTLELYSIDLSPNDNTEPNN